MGFGLAPEEMFACHEPQVVRPSAARPGRAALERWEQVGPSREILSEQKIGVFVRLSLPRTLLY